MRKFFYAATVLTLLSFGSIVEADIPPGRHPRPTNRTDPELSTPDKSTDSGEFELGLVITAVLAGGGLWLLRRHGKKS